VKTVDDYIREAWQAILAGDYARRDELCEQAKRLMDIQKNGFDPDRSPITVICLPDRSNEVLS